MGKEAPRAGKLFLMGVFVPDVGAPAELSAALGMILWWISAALLWLDVIETPLFPESLGEV